LFTFYTISHIFAEKMQRKLPSICPSCSAHLRVTGLQCPVCSTGVDGSFELPWLLKLDPEELKFIVTFVKFSGSLKEMAREMNLSYPTVRNYLDDLIHKMRMLEEANEPR
jgi:hypothetical protein